MCAVGVHHLLKKALSAYIPAPPNCPSRWPKNHLTDHKALNTGTWGGLGMYPALQASPAAGRQLAPSRGRAGAGRGAPKPRRRLGMFSYRDLEPIQGEPTQTNRDYQGLSGTMRALRDHWGPVVPMSLGKLPLGRLSIRM